MMKPQIGEVSKQCLAKHSNCPESRLILSVHVVCHPGESPQFCVADIIQGGISIDRRELDSLEESLEYAYCLPDDHKEEFVHVARVEESGEWESFPAWSQYFVVTSFQDIGFGVEVPSDRDRLASDLYAKTAELERVRSAIELADKALEWSNYAEDHPARTGLRAALASMETGRG